MGKQIYDIVPPSAPQQKKRTSRVRFVARSHDFIPRPVQRELSRWVRIARVLFTTSKYAGVFSAVALVVVSAGLVWAWAAMFGGEHAEVFPTRVEVSASTPDGDNWFNSGQALTRELSADAVSDDFNASNSAASTVAEEHDVSAPEDASIFERVRIFLGLGTARAQDATEQPAPTESTSEPVEETPAEEPETGEPPAAEQEGESAGAADSAEGVEENAPPDEPELLVPDVDGELPPAEEAAEEPESPVTIYTRYKSIELSGFSLSNEKQVDVIRQVQIKLSFASRGVANEDDHIALEWSTDGTQWNAAHIFQQNTFYSNNLNDDYFAFDITEELAALAGGSISAYDISALRLRVTAFSNNETFTAAYVDSAWLDVAYDEKTPELTYDEKPKVRLAADRYTSAPENDFRADEDPLFAFVNPQLTLVDLQNMADAGDVEVLADKKGKLRGRAEEQIAQEEIVQEEGVRNSEVENGGEPENDDTDAQKDTGVEDSLQASPTEPILKLVDDIIDFLFGAEEENADSVEQAPSEESQESSIEQPAGESVDAAEAPTPEEDRGPDQSVGEEHVEESEQATEGGEEAEPDENTDVPVDETPSETPDILEQIIDIILPKDAQAQANAGESISARVLDPLGVQSNILANVTRSFGTGGERFEVSLKKPLNSFRPGRYTLEVEIESSDSVVVLRQDFSWGVLAVNVDKSIYTPQDTQAYIQMGVLDDGGYTICDADVQVAVTAPNGAQTLFTTADGTVQYSGECKGNSVVQVPDYFAYYELPQEVGVYTVEVQATHKNGTHTIADAFEVRPSVPLDVARRGPTRIYPLEPYPVTLSVVANEDFTGVVRERVPASFEISSPQNSTPYSDIRIEGEEQVIMWNVDLKQGDSVEFGYWFDAPDVSPEFYLLGPLQFYAGLQQPPVFEEVRRWNVASDDTAVTTFVFASDAESWAYTDDNGSCSGAFTSGAGNPSGSLQTTGSKGGGATTCNAYWEWSGTWEDLGVTSGDDVTGIDGAYDYAVSDDSSNGTWNTGAFELRNSGGTLRETLEAALTGQTGTASWTTRNASGEQTFTAEASTTSIRLRVNTVIAFGGGNRTWAGQNDNISVTVTHTTPGAGFDVSGTFYPEAETGNEPGQCDGSTENLSLRIDGGTAITTSCTDTTGAFTFSGVDATAGQTITMYSTGADKANRVYVSDGTADTGMDLYDNAVAVGDEQDGTIALGDMTDYDNDQNATDMLFDAEAGSLIVEDGTELHIHTGDTFTPGGTVTTDPAADSTTQDGDVHIDGTGTLNMAANALSVGGDFDNEGTFTATTTQVTTFTGTDAAPDFAITDGGENFRNVTFNGSGGEWEFADSTTIEVDLVMTAGTLNETGSDTITVNGDVEGTAGVINLTGTSTLEQRVAATELFGPTTANTDWTFYNLTFSRSAGTAVVDTNACSDCDITVTNQLAVSKSGDGAGTTLQAGDKTWSLTSANQADPFNNDGQGSDAGVLTAETSTFDYAGDNDAGDVVVENVTYFNLTLTSDGVAENYDAAAAVTVASDLTVNANATLIGADNWTVNGSVAGAGTVTFTGGTFEQRVSVNENFGTSGSNTWTFINLTFSNGNGGGVARTVTTISAAGGITVSGILLVGKSGDAASDTTTLDAGNRTWTLSGTAGDPFQILASPAGNLTPSTSTFAYTGDNGGGNTTVQSETYNTLQVNNGSETYALEGTTQGAAVTISAGVLDTGANALTATGDFTITGTLQGTGNVTANGNVTGAGTVTMTGGTFEQQVAADKNFGSSSGSNTWTFSGLKFNNSDGAAVHTITPNAGTGDIVVSGTLTFGDSGTQTITFDNESSNDRAFDMNGDFVIASQGIFQASSSASFTVAGSFSNSGTFTANSGTVTLDGTGSGLSITSGGDSFNNLEINNGLEGYWKMDEGTGVSLRDLSGRGNTGTAFDTTSWSTAVNSATDYFSNPGSLTLGSDGYAGFGDVAAVDGATAFSAALWVKHNSLTADGTLLAKDIWGTGGPILLWRDEQASVSLRTDTYTILVGDGTNSARVEGATNAANDNNWHHVAVTFLGGDASGLRLYIDGIEDANSPVSTATVDAFESNNDNLQVGRPTDATNFLQGGVDDARIWSRVLSGNEITALANGNHPGDGVDSTEGTYTLSDALVVAGNLNVRTGMLDISATEFPVNVGGNYLNVANFKERTGTITLDASSGTPTVQSDDAFYNLIIDDSGGPVTFTVEDQRLDITGDLTISGGTLDVSASGCWGGGSCNIELSGNFTNNDTFTARSGTVTFDGATTTVLAGSGSPAITFNNFTSITASKTINFTASETFRINGIFTIDGQASGTQINLHSTSQSTKWTINHQGTESIQFAHIEDGGCDGSSTNISVDSTSTDSVSGSGNDSCWLFPALSFILDATSRSIALDNGNTFTNTATSTLTVTARSEFGYDLTAYETGDLSHTAAAATIADWTGTNASPTVFDETCIANPAKCGWGYNTDDADLTQFTDSTYYAGFTQTAPGDIVAKATSPVTSDVTTITYRVSVSAIQEAGPYETTIRYIVTPKF